MPDTQLRALVPIVRVQDVVRSIEFYRQLGFALRNKLESEGRVVWGWLDNGKAHLMLNRSLGPRGSRTEGSHPVLVLS